MKKLLPRKEILDELLRSVGTTNRDTMQKVLHQAWKTPPEERPEKIGELLAQHLWATEGPKKAALIFRAKIDGKKVFTDQEYKCIFPEYCLAEIHEGERYLNECWKEIENDKHTILSVADKKWIDEWVKKKRLQEQKALDIIRTKKERLDAESAYGRARLEHNRKVSRKGGEGAALHKTEQIIGVFRAYKKRRAIVRINAAINHIITKRDSHPDEYLNYANPSGLFKRLKKIAKAAGYKTPTAWYQGL